MVVLDLSPNKFVGCAALAKAPPKIDADVFVGDDALADKAPNEADPKRPLFADN